MHAGQWGIAALTWVVIGLLAAPFGPSANGEISPWLVSLVVVVTVIACAICVLRWRLLGNPSYLLAAVGISLLETVKSSAALTTAPPALLALGFLAGVGLVGAAASAFRAHKAKGKTVDRLVVLAVFVGVAMTTVPDLARVLAGGLPRAGSIADAAAHTAVAAVLLWLSRRHHHGEAIDDFHAWIAAVLAFRAHSRMALALAANGEPVWVLGSQVFMAESAVLLLGAALSAMGRDMARQRQDLSAATTALDEAVAQQRRLVGDMAKRRHDVNSSMFCIGGTSALLDEGWADLDPEERRMLIRGLRTEADRMRTLIVDHNGVDPGVSRLQDVIPPIVLAARARGRDVRLTGLDGAAAVIPPHELAAVVAALLDDAQRRAPYSPVDVQGGVVDGEVRLVVADHGPRTPRGIEPVLADVRRVLQQFRATLSAEETPGGGGSVVIHLRRSQSGEATCPSNRLPA